MADPSLSPDSALELPSEDKLGYDNFAKHLADAIQRQTPKNGFVIGIYGDWGSGKSTVLNFIEHHLDESDSIIRFNPWWFSGQNDLLEKFLIELRDGLDQDQFDDVRDNLSNYARKISSIPIGKLLGYPLLDEITSEVPALLESDLDDINTLKDNIEEGLGEDGERIIVLIDDIDRLSAEEIQQMFRLVKSVADFPSITYVLAFDQNVVVPALSERSDLKGDEYLEKIVQLPIHLPTPQQHSIENIFSTNFKQVVGEQWNPRNEERWVGLLQNGIHPLLDTPRDAVRLSNVLNISYSAFEEKSDINIIDLVGIEAIRIFYRETYEIIRDQPSRFAGIYDEYSVGIQAHNDEEDSENYSDIFEEIEDSKRKMILKVILSYLFPKCSRSFSLDTPREDTASYGRRRRICDDEIFSFYFRLAVPREGISVSMIRQMIQSDPEEFNRRLMELQEDKTASGRKMSHVFLTQLQEYITDIDTSDIRPLIKGLFMDADILIEDDSKSDILFPRNEHLLNNLIRDLLRQIEQEQRGEVLETVIADTETEIYSIILVRQLYKEHGMFGSEAVPENKRLLSNEQIESLSEMIVDKITIAAENDEILESDYSYSMFSYWVEVDETGAKDWFESVTEDMDGLMRFIENILISEKSEEWKVSPAWVNSFSNLECIETRLSETEKDDLTQKHQMVIDIFLEGKESYDRTKPRSF